MSILTSDVVDTVVCRAIDIKNTIHLFGLDACYEAFKKFLKMLDLNNAEYEEAIIIGIDILEDGLTKDKVNDSWKRTRHKRN